MTAPLRNPPPSIAIRIGSWFEARASGWGVAVVPIALLLALAAPLVARLF